MFEQSVPEPAQSPSPAQVLAPEGEPTEFIYKGRRFHIHATLSRWRESGGWWNRIDDGGVARAHSKNADLLSLNDGDRAVWRVEAAPEGALATFEIELDEITGTWKIRPTSRTAL